MNITGVSFRTCIGNDLATVCGNLNKKARGLKKDHSFLRHTDAVLGEVAADSPRTLALDSADESDKLTRLTFSLIEELDDQTNCFSRYKPEEIGLFFGTTTASYNRSIDLMNKFIDKPGGVFQRFCHRYFHPLSLRMRTSQVVAIAGSSIPQDLS